ncbi:MAG: methionyl-tRNA formyltransferase [Chitinophagales bacterium]
MMEHKLKIIYMGTPEFAVPGLRVLAENGFNIVAVVTAPDKPAGRGLKITTSPVKDFAVENKIPVLQPAKLKDENFISALKSYDADLQIVVAFRMLPEIVWSMPRSGTINLHASLLPDYRGAAPINHVIINGEKETGVTTFFLKHAIDTGDIIFQEKIPIQQYDDAGTLHDKLMDAGAELILKTVGAIESGNYTPIPQLQQSEKIAPKIFKNDCQINWNSSAEEVHNFIRGLSPYPGAFTFINDKPVKILRSAIEQDAFSDTPGKFATDNKTYLTFSTAFGCIQVKEIQAEGKRRMLIEEYLRGNRIN